MFPIDRKVLERLWLYRGNKPSILPYTDDPYKNYIISRQKVWNDYKKKKEKKEQQNQEKQMNDLVEKAINKELEKFFNRIIKK